MNKVKVNGYEFEVDERTGTMIASGALSVGKTAPRTHRAAKAGGSRHEESDHDGHGIAARFNGPTIEENLSAMNGKINQGSYKRMENAEVALLKTGASVQTERIAYVYRHIARTFEGWDNTFLDEVCFTCSPITIDENCIVVYSVLYIGHDFRSNCIFVQIFIHVQPPMPSL